jgi:hypothetical protein
LAWRFQGAGSGVGGENGRKQWPEALRFLQNGALQDACLMRNEEFQVARLMRNEEFQVAGMEQSEI